VVIALVAFRAITARFAPQVTEYLSGGRAATEARIATLIADRDGDVVAAAFLRWASPPANLAPELHWAEIARFYVAKPYWRTGISSDLMVAALASIREREGELVWLQAWEGNAVALRFYRKWGFLEVGEAPFKLGPELQRDLVLARSLRPDSRIP